MKNLLPPCHVKVIIDDRMVVKLVYKQLTRFYFELRALINFPLRSRTLDIGRDEGVGKI